MGKTKPGCPDIIRATRLPWRVALGPQFCALAFRQVCQRKNLTIKFIIQAGCATLSACVKRPNKTHASLSSLLFYFICNFFKIINCMDILIYSDYFPDNLSKLYHTFPKITHHNLSFLINFLGNGTNVI